MDERRSSGRLRFAGRLLAVLLVLLVVAGAVGIYMFFTVKRSELAIEAVRFQCLCQLSLQAEEAGEQVTWTVEERHTPENGNFLIRLDRPSDGIRIEPEIHVLFRGVVKSGLVQSRSFGGVGLLFHLRWANGVLDYAEGLKKPSDVSSQLMSTVSCQYTVERRAPNALTIRVDASCKQHADPESILQQQATLSVEVAAPEMKKKKK